MKKSVLAARALSQGTFKIEKSTLKSFKQFLRYNKMSFLTPFLETLGIFEVVNQASPLTSQPLPQQVTGILNQDPTYFAQQTQRERLHQYVLSQYPEETAKTIHQIAKEIAQQGLGQTLDLTKAEQMAQSLGISLYRQLPQTEEYNAIASVYNGLNMTIENNQRMYRDPRNGLIYFEFIDELGQIAVLYENTTGMIGPSYDTFTGAYSPNNKLATTLTGLFSMGHDIDYTLNGFFNVTSDYKFISRLSNNFYRMTDAEKPYARTAILYFSTVSNLLGSLENQTYKQGIIGSVPTRDPNFVMPETFYQTEVQRTSPMAPIVNMQQYLEDVRKELGQMQINDPYITAQQMAFADFGSTLVSIL